MAADVHIIPGPKAQSNDGTKPSRTASSWKITSCPGDLRRQVGTFVDHYNNHRYHECLNNVTPADAYFGRDAAIIERRKKIKRQTIKTKRPKLKPDEPEPPLNQMLKRTICFDDGQCKPNPNPFQERLGHTGPYRDEVRCGANCQVNTISAHTSFPQHLVALLKCDHESLAASLHPRFLGEILSFSLSNWGKTFHGGHFHR